MSIIAIILNCGENSFSAIQNYNKMDTTKILTQNYKSDNEISRKKVKTSILSKSILVIIMLSCITLLYSCDVMVRAPRQDRNGITNDRQGRNDRNNRHDRHDNDDRNDHDDHRN